MAQLTIQQIFDQAARHHQAGRLHEAEQLYRQAIAVRPNFPEAFGNLGNVLKDKGQLDDAIAAFRQAISLNVNLAGAYVNLGNALKDKGEFEESIAVCRQAIALRPDYAEAFNNLGNALKETGQLDESIAASRKAIALKPDYPEAFSNLANALNQKGQFDESIAASRRAIALKPDFPEAHVNLGNALKDKGQLVQAITAFQQAITLRPGYAEAGNNLANVLSSKGQLDEAVVAYRQAIALRPNYAEAHHNLSFALLARGDFEQGWEEYEWRWKCKDFPSPARNFPQPQWNGETLQNRTLLLHTEQGLGDAIQFARYVPLVAQRGAKIIIECQPSLQQLFQTLADGLQIVPDGQPLPSFDLHCPLLSLPRVFGTNLATIPNTVPYLKPDPALMNKWSERLGPPTGQLKVGLAWAGNPQFKADQTRSLTLQQLAPFAAVPNVTFFSLQKGPAAQQTNNPPAGLKLIDLSPDLNDFANTAAVMSLLDLIITTDTSIPHLAGALGRPVWTMLQFVPDFRWLLQRDDSPWYPTMRLFRQSHPGDWNSTIAEVVDALSLRIKNST